MLLRDTIKQLEIGEGITVRNLTMFPLLGTDSGPADYLTLDEALAQKVAHITEVSEGGSVPELRFVNESDLRVLLMDGEALVGAKQNRTLNLTILAPAHSTLLLPVTCVEAGRWAHASAEFSTAPHAHYAAGRARKHASVSESLRFRGDRAADQGEVWEDINLKAARMAAPSPTRDMTAMYARHETGLEEYVQALPAQARQRGAVFAIGEEVVGCELFDSAATLGKLLPKIVSSYALDALDARPQESPRPAGRDAVDAFLQAIADAQTQTFAAIGVGEDVRLQAAGLAGGALLAEGRVIHLSAFRLEIAEAEEQSSGIATLLRASARRRNWQISR